VGPAYFNCPFHMRQISVLDEKKMIFLYLLGTKPLMEMEDRIQSVHIAGIKIESICFKLVRPVNSIRYISIL
jgi:hypothetical protein